MIVSHLWVLAAVRDGFIPDPKEFEVSDEETGGGSGPRRSRIAKEKGELGMFNGYKQTYFCFVPFLMVILLQI